MSWSRTRSSNIWKSAKRDMKILMESDDGTTEEIELDDDLLSAMEKYAEDHEITFDQAMNQALRAYIESLESLE